MTYKNSEVIEEFVKYGLDEKVKAGHLYFEQDVLFSYGTHFPLCIRLKNGWVINSDRYSNTTSNHQGELIRQITGDRWLNLTKFIKVADDFSNIKLCTTKEIKDIIFNLLNKHGSLRFITIADLTKLRMLKNI